ncbi:hypothetical protein BX666DRAFT_1876740 [Dichotomocladium elegans]|nr:hypothetical protein BX666DRAFT_1876740 [Dichotomocladium elegans]
MLNKHPGSLLDASDVVRIDRGQRGLFKFVIERDCENLLFAFVKQSSHDYEDFLHIWNEQKFYLIHFAGIMKEDRPEIMQELYNCFIGGKPTSNKEHARATLAFHRLMKDSAFVFVAQTDVAAVNPFEIEELKPSTELLESIKSIKRKRIEQDAASVCSKRFRLQNFNDLADAYQKAKSLVLEAPQALITAQKHHKSRTTVTEYNERFLRRALYGTTLAAKEADFQRVLDTASAALWKARQTRLENMPLIFNESKRKRYARRMPSDSTNNSRRTTADSSDEDSVASVSSSSSASSAT